MSKQISPTKMRLCQTESREVEVNRSGMDKKTGLSFQQHSTFIQLGKRFCKWIFKEEFWIEVVSLFVIPRNF